ncbi:hypothetical protein LWI28_021523 [Acer negundo]|uniref:Uncharacterized protein n=1 Tax=Acer negundo TaxID=4023 RepID=A0AAD5JQ29_ACENE|nr:hypothetical protein LWI28_021523 [Acer negundo]
MYGGFEIDLVCVNRLKKMVEMDFVSRSLFVSKKRNRLVFGQWCKCGVNQRLDLGVGKGDEVFDNGGYLVLGERSGHDEHEKNGDMDNGHNRCVNWSMDSGVKKKVEIKVEDDDDTNGMVVQNGFVDGHSTFDIRFSSRMNLQLRFDESPAPFRRSSRSARQAFTLCSSTSKWLQSPTMATVPPRETTDGFDTT